MISIGKKSINKIHNGLWFPYFLNVAPQYAIFAIPFCAFLRSEWMMLEESPFHGQWPETGG